MTHTMEGFIMNITTEGNVLFQLTTDAEKDAMSHLSDYLNNMFFA